MAFLDGYNSGMAQTNLANFLTEVGVIAPAGWAPITQTLVAGNIAAPLNTASLYAPSFAALPTINGGAWSNMAPIPSDYVLYTQNALSSPPPATVSDAYGFIIPQQASNGGAGACLIMFSDASPFQINVPAQPNAVAQTFYAAATAPDGACAQPMPGAPALITTLTGPGDLTVGLPGHYNLRVSNIGNASSANGQQVSLDLSQLPAGTTVDTSTIPAYCSATATAMTCSLPAIGAGDHVDVPFAITATSTFTNKPITSTLPGVTPTPRRSNTNTLNLNARAFSAAAVPTLNEWALMLLALAMLGMAGAGFKRRG